MVTTRPFVVALAALVLWVSACSSGGKQSTPTSGARRRQQALATNLPAGSNPSASTTMVCGTEVRTEIASALGGFQARVTTPTWADHIYSCTYAYPKGSVRLSVKELVSAQATTAYFNALANRLGRAPQFLNGLGQGAFFAKNEDVIVRKDYRVLLVDVQGVPAPRTRDSPTLKRSEVGEDFAAVIMGCWTGG